MARVVVGFGAMAPRPGSGTTGEILRSGVQDLGRATEVMQRGPPGSRGRQSVCALPRGYGAGGSTRGKPLTNASTSTSTVTVSRAHSAGPHVIGEP